MNKWKKDYVALFYRGYSLFIYVIYEFIYTNVQKHGAGEET